jgi:hypothetical protein
MLRNVPVSELIRVLLLVQKESALCDIKIDDVRPGITFIPIYDSSQTRGKLNIDIPNDKIVDLDSKNLDDLIV